MEVPKSPIKLLFYKKVSYSKEYLDKRFDYLLQYIYDYHHKYGKYGFLSEKTDEVNIYSKAKTDLELETRNEGEPKLHEITVNQENYLEFIDKIENDPNFVSWFMDIEEQIESSKKV